MGDWDEFGDRSDYFGTTESLDSFDESSFETAESIDISSTMDSVESMPVEFDDVLVDDAELELQIGTNFENIDNNALSPMNEAETQQVEFDAETYEDDVEELNEMRPIDELGTWLEEINPNFDPFDIDSPYCNNCGSCAYAVYQRLEGNPNICATTENIEYNDEMEALTGMEQVVMSPAEIETRLLEQGDGSHAIIGIDREVGPGHWFNAANIGGKVVAIDGQTGEINDWPPDYGNVVNWEMSIKKEI